ncbi:MAG: M64 family metallopeptidase [Saprospiraceae bacterium]
MKKKAIILAIHFLILEHLFSQALEMDTIQYHGSPDKFINFVILGDGYTQQEQDQFIQNSKQLSNYLFRQVPWSNYIQYFNVFAVKVISAESGTKHPNSAPDCGNSQPITNPDTYFGCSFDVGNIHRLVVPSNYTHISNVLSSNFPLYDQVCIIANSIYYGGSGGTFATTTINSSSNEVYAHELGHSFAGLSDEYYAGDNYARENINMTRQTDSTQVRWRNWMNTQNIGIYQHCCGGNSAEWYKPNTGCKMQSLGGEYCSVCKEAIIEKIHSLTNPIVSYQPIQLNQNTQEKFIVFKLTELMKPIENTLKLVWNLDGKDIAWNIDSMQLDQSLISFGKHTLTVSCEDTSNFIRVNRHSTKHFNTVSWNIDRTTTGIKLVPADQKISYSIFPNPVQSVLNVSVNVDAKNKLNINLLTLNGVILNNIVKDKLITEHFEQAMNIENLNPGTYIVQFQIGTFKYNEVFTKQ